METGTNLSAAREAGVRVLVLPRLIVGHTQYHTFSIRSSTMKPASASSLVDRHMPPTQKRSFTCASVVTQQPGVARDQVRRKPTAPVSDGPALLR